MALTKITSTNIGANAVTADSIGYTPVNKAGDTMSATLALSKSMTTQYDGIGVRMASSSANVSYGATFLQHTFIDAGSDQTNYVYNHSLRRPDGTYISNVYTADYKAGVHSWYHPNAGLSGNPVMQIDASGRVQAPYQPAFRATRNSTTQNLAANTRELVQFNVAETNIGNCYNTSNYRFTAPVAGFYAFSASFLVSKASSTRIDIIFTKNAADLVNAEAQALNSTSTNTYIANSMQCYLNANDYIEVYTRINDNGSIYAEPKFWNFSGFLIG